MNYEFGAPGSYFVFYITGFPPNTTVNFTINGVLILTITTNGEGYAIVVITTTNADVGHYTVTASAQSNGAQVQSISSASTRFMVDTSAPVRANTETGVPPADLPAGIAQTIVYLPMAQR